MSVCGLMMLVVVAISGRILGPGASMVVITENNTCHSTFYVRTNDPIFRNVMSIV